MAQVQTYEDLKNAKLEKERLMTEHAQNKGAVGQEMSGRVQNSENGVLKKYLMEKQGLGEIDPGAYVRSQTIAPAEAEYEKIRQTVLGMIGSGQVPFEAIENRDDIPAGIKSEAANMVGLGQIVQ